MNAALIAQMMEEDENRLLAEQMQNEAFGGGPMNGGGGPGAFGMDPGANVR